MKEKLIYLIPIAIVLTGLLELPYGCYIVMRVIMMLVFGGLAIKHLGNNKIIGVITYAALFIIYQPILKLPFDRDIWIVMDIIAAGVLFIDMLFSKHK